jgi:dihydroxyacetone kinase-like protein
LIMGDITSAGLRSIFQAIGDAIEVDKGRLSELDGVIGDADHGVTMSIGFTAVNEALAKLDASADPTTVFNTAAKSFLNAVGASSGPLYGTAFMRAGAAVKGKAAIDRDGLADCIAAMAKGMQDRGKAERGEKTMMDAWLPAADAAQEAKARGDDAVSVLQSAVAAAEAGAEATKAMLATKGRASRLGERALGHMDPGAASAVTILKAMTDAVRKL